MRLSRKFPLHKHKCPVCGLDEVLTARQTEPDEAVIRYQYGEHEDMAGTARWGPQQHRRRAGLLSVHLRLFGEASGRKWQRLQKMTSLNRDKAMEDREMYSV